MSTQPKIRRNMLIRSAIGLFIAAGLFLGYSILQRRGEDIDLGTANTVGWIAAVKYLPRGSQAVVITPDGGVKEAPGYNAGNRDDDLVWRPDGNRIFFASDREDNAKNIYRWNLATNAVARRTLGKMTRSNPSFPVDKYLNAEQEATLSVNPLIIAGGAIWLFDPSKAKSTLVVPRQNGGMSAEHNESSEGAADSGLGSQTRAKKALYFKSGKFVAYTRDTDEGETLMVEYLLDPKTAPIAVMTADKFYLAVDPATGNLLYTVVNFRFPNPNSVPDEYIKNGKAVKPFLHGLFVFDPTLPTDQANQSIISGKDAKSCFLQPAPSTDGSAVLLVYGNYKDVGDVDPQGILLMPLKVGGGKEARKIVTGPVSWPTWNPDNKHIAYEVDINGTKSVIVSDPDGQHPLNMTEGKGNFGHPQFSPQRG